MLSTHLADAARSLVGCAFVAGGRDASVGVDCAGLVIVSLRMCGCDPQDASYALVPGGDLMGLVLGCLETMFDPFPLVPADWLPGDVLVMRYGHVLNHIGVYLGGGSMVHALQGAPPVRNSAIPEPARGVVISPIDHGLARKVRSVWRLR